MCVKERVVGAVSFLVLNRGGGGDARPILTVQRYLLFVVWLHCLHYITYMIIYTKMDTYYNMKIKETFNILC